MCVLKLIVTVQVWRDALVNPLELLDQVESLDIGFDDQISRMPSTASLTQFNEQRNKSNFFKESWLLSLLDSVRRLSDNVFERLTNATNDPTSGVQTLFEPEQGQEFARVFQSAFCLHKSSALCIASDK